MTKQIDLHLAHSSVPIFLGESLSSQLAEWVQQNLKGKKVAIVTQAPCMGIATQAEASLKAQGLSPEIHEIPNGESAKSLSTINELMSAFLAQGLERIDTVLAVGGGVVGDAAGFAASVYLRGVPFIQYPTTLLAQVDAAIGGKTGVNHESGKNLIGTFYQPKAIFVDFKSLDSLPPEAFHGGLAEIVKYGFILDAALLEDLLAHKEAIRKGAYQDAPELWQDLVQRSIQHKVDVVSNDEKEALLREILNFGHSIGHALEAASAYKKLSHGEAIAIGMAGELRLSRDFSDLSAEDCDYGLSVLKGLGFELSHESSDIDQLCYHISKDKKNRGDQIRIVLLSALGSAHTQVLPLEPVRDEMAALYQKGE